jgi:hypothetical protein
LISRRAVTLADPIAYAYFSSFRISRKKEVATADGIIATDYGADDNVGKGPASK